MLTLKKMLDYKPIEIERKWQKRFLDSQIFNIKDEEVTKKDKLYLLVMFPYPSGNLHMGHWYNYTGADVMARYLRMNGKKVLFPIGYDAFGLPAENAAIKRGIHPAVWTESNIARMRKQLLSTGCSFDWSREINTSKPEYYKWTQWFFLLFYKNGLAERVFTSANFCPSCQTILANEQVINGRCERCSSVVVQKRIKQWVFKITKYADRLLKDLSELDWPKKTKLMQENWIGRSEGSLISFPVLLDNSKQKEFVSVFTTRADTLFGVTYLVLAPEHPLVEKITTKERKKAVEAYVEETAKKTHFEREELANMREKTGVFTGGFAFHPLTGEKLPIYIADYVIYGYGTGAVMAVPAHDQRDFEFAVKYSLEIKTVVAPAHLRGQALRNFKVEKEAFTDNGVLINSSEFSGLPSGVARKKITERLIQKNLGSFSVSYHLRDWVISRQRYWGAPIPIIYCEKCGTVPVPEKDLPVILPEISDFAPRGVSPLATNPQFLWTRCPKCGQKAQRETDTMDTFICSSWYFYRYCDSKNKQAFASQEKLQKWLPVDYYIGGSEHAVMHLLYARFFNKVLYDLGYAPSKEPFLRLRHQGIILGADGYKMSKSRGNVVDPDELVSKYGADSVRTFLMFMGPYEEGGPWNPRGLAGVYRFLNKIIRFFSEKKLTEEKSLTKESLVWRNRTIKKVSQDILGFSFNTAVSALMEWFNYLQKASASKEDLEIFLKLLSPFAPHLCEKLWERLGNKSFISLSPWPAYNANLVEFDEVCYGVLVNGKKRGELRVDASLDAKEVEKRAIEIENVKKYLLGKRYKVIFVPGKIINFVV